MRGKISFLITDWFLSSKSSQQARYFVLLMGYVIPKWRPCPVLECWLLAIKLPVIPIAGKMQTLRWQSLIKVDDCNICFFVEFFNLFSDS